MTYKTQLHRPELGSLLGAVHCNVLNCSQCAQRRLLCLGHSSDPRDIESLVGSVTPQGLEMLATLHIPHLNGIVVPATGQPLTIGTYAERLDRTLMLLPKRQALPVLHVPPAQVPIAATTDQHRSGRTPGQRVYDHVRLTPGLQALPTLRIPDDDFPAAPASATAAQSRAIGPPGYPHDHATMPLDLL